MDLTLVVLAAGSSTRFGRLKQLEPIGPAGEVLLDYAIYDAIRAGFTRVVVVVQAQHEAAFFAQLEPVRAFGLNLCFAHQGLTLAGFVPEPPLRSKQWGTGAALLAAAPWLTNGPIVVCNADDYYGPSAYTDLAQVLTASNGAVPSGPCAAPQTTTPTPSDPIVPFGPCSAPQTDEPGLGRAVPSGPSFAPQDKSDAKRDEKADREFAARDRAERGEPHEVLDLRKEEIAEQTDGPGLGSAVPSSGCSAPQNAELGRTDTDPADPAGRAAPSDSCAIPQTTTHAPSDPTVPFDPCSAPQTDEPGLGRAVPSGPCSAPQDKSDAKRDEKADREFAARDRAERGEPHEVLDLRKGEIAEQTDGPGLGSAVPSGGCSAPQNAELGRTDTDPADPAGSAVLFGPCAAPQTTTHAPTAHTVTYRLADTLSDNGGVSRGLCEVGADSTLAKITEGLELRRHSDDVFGHDPVDNPLRVSLDTPVCTNFWGFPAEVMGLLRDRFSAFLASAPTPEQEFFLTEALNDLIVARHLTCKVYPARDRWLGVTFPRDRDVVATALREMTNAGVYPSPLWGGPDR